MHILHIKLNLNLFPVPCATSPYRSSVLVKFQKAISLISVREIPFPQLAVIVFVILEANLREDFGCYCDWLNIIQPCIPKMLAWLTVFVIANLALCYAADTDMLAANAGMAADVERFNVNHN